MLSVLFNEISQNNTKSTIKLSYIHKLGVIQTNIIEIKLKMNFDYSIETSLENIQNSKSKQYFQEVYQTYINKNYRSSVVMLYSVLICDLVFKLRDLRDIYSDSKAEKILKEIEDLQIANPTSPEWETKLIDAVKTKTNLLE